MVGATGNTGQAVTRTLPKLLGSSSTLSGSRIIALTRSSSSPVAQELAKLPGVALIEQNWVDITADWLREHHIARAFIVSHNEPNQFAEESTCWSQVCRANLDHSCECAPRLPSLLSTPALGYRSSPRLTGVLQLALDVSSAECLLDTYHGTCCGAY